MLDNPWCRYLRYSSMHRSKNEYFDALILWIIGIPLIIIFESLTYYDR